MRRFISKLTYKSGILILALMIVVFGTALIEKQAHPSSPLSKAAGEVAGVFTDKFSTVVPNAIAPANVSAQALSAYQNVAGNVSISGNVGIGTTGTATQKLDVSGIVKATSFIGNLTGNVTGNVTGDLTGNVTGNATTATTLSGNNGKTGKESRLYRSDSETSYNYYLRHYWTASTSGWRITGSNSIGDEQANIHRVSVDYADSAGSINGWGIYVNGRPRMYDIGCGGNWGGSCDANGTGWTDYADSAPASDVPAQSKSLNQWVNTDSNVTHNQIYANDWFRVNGAAGIYWQSYGIGWQVTDGTWLRTYNNASIVAANGQIGTNSMQMGGNRYGWTDRGCTGCADSINGNPNVWITAQSQVYVRSPNWNANDVAELYPIADNADTADLVSIAQTVNGFAMKKSSKAYDQNIAGVISDNPAILFDGSGLIIGWKPGTYNGQDEQEIKALQDLKEQHKGKKPVALAGRIPFNVSSINGSIKQGDPITSSDIPGVGMKATQAGQIIGKALENFDESKATPCSDNPQYLCSKIMVFVNVSWFDPDAYLTSTNNFHLDFNQVKDAVNNLITRIGAFSEIIAGKIQAGIIETKQLVVNGVNILDRLDAQQKEIDALKAEIESLKK